MGLTIANLKNTRRVCAWTPYAVITRLTDLTGVIQHVQQTTILNGLFLPLHTWVSRGHIVISLTSCTFRAILSGGVGQAFINWIHCLTFTGTIQKVALQTLNTMSIRGVQETMRDYSHGVNRASPILVQVVIGFTDRAGLKVLEGLTVWNGGLLTSILSKVPIGMSYVLKVVILYISKHQTVGDVLLLLNVEILIQNVPRLTLRAVVKWEIQTIVHSGDRVAGLFVKGKAVAWFALQTDPALVGLAIRNWVLNLHAVGVLDLVSLITGGAVQTGVPAYALGIGGYCFCGHWGAFSL